MTQSKRLLVLYGTQTFTSQDIAEKIWRTAKALGLVGPVQGMDEYPVSSLIHEEHAIFVCSTTGQGDEPDNMKKFWKFLLKKNLPSNSLVKLKFGVLALGDSSYTKFNFVGKKLHKRLIQLGATPLLEVGLCDYQHDLGHDAVVSPWLKNYWTKLQTYIPNLEINGLESKFITRWNVEVIRSDESISTPVDCISEDIYFRRSLKNNSTLSKCWEVSDNVRTTDESHFQDVRLITLKVVDSVKLTYQPGDIFNIRPRNSKEDIEELFLLFQEHDLDIKPHYRLSVQELHGDDKLPADRKQLYCKLAFARDFVRVKFMTRPVPSSFVEIIF